MFLFFAGFRGGLTEPLEQLQFDEVKIAFEYFRTLVELKHDKFMTRRTMLYQPVLQAQSSIKRRARRRGARLTAQLCSTPFAQGDPAAVQRRP